MADEAGADHVAAAIAVLRDETNVWEYQDALYVVLRRLDAATARAAALEVERDRLRTALGNAVEQVARSTNNPWLGSADGKTAIALLAQSGHGEGEGE